MGLKQLTIETLPMRMLYWLSACTRNGVRFTIAKGNDAFQIVIGFEFTEEQLGWPERCMLRMGTEPADFSPLDEFEQLHMYIGKVVDREEQRDKIKADRDRALAKLSPSEIKLLGIDLNAPIKLGD